VTSEQGIPTELLTAFPLECRKFSALRHWTVGILMDIPAEVATEQQPHQQIPLTAVVRGFVQRLKRAPDESSFLHGEAKSDVFDFDTDLSEANEKGSV
jgi:hypothetical protein